MQAEEGKKGRKEGRMKEMKEGKEKGSEAVIVTHQMFLFKSLNIGLD